MILNIELLNWKKHENLKIEFNKGSNILIGNMGSGKTSILQAITYCLFGTFSELKKRELKINDLIKRGETISEIKLFIENDNAQFLITRKIEYDKPSEATIRDDSGELLAGPNPTAVNDYIIDKFKITEEIFLRTIYSVQNEADILLRIGPAERKKQIDELMNLDQFEIVRKNCVSLSNKLNERKKGMLSILDQENVELLQNLGKRLETEIDELVSKQKEISSSIPSLEKIEVATRTKLEKISLMNSRKNQLLSRKEELELKIEKINIKVAGQNISKTEDEINNLISSFKERTTSLKSKIEKRKDNHEELNRDLILIEKQRGIIESNINSITSEISSLMEIKIRFKDLQIQDFREIDSRINTIKSEIKNRDELNRDNQAEINNMRKHMSQLELISDICPLCRHELAQHTKERLLSERKQEIAKLLMENNEITNKLQILKNEEESLTKSYNNQQEFLASSEKESELNEKRDKSNIKLQSFNSRRNNILRKLEEIKSKLNQLDLDITTSNEDIEKFVDSKSLLSLKNNLQDYEKELKQIIEELKIATIESKNYN